MDHDIQPCNYSYQQRSNDTDNPYYNVTANLTKYPFAAKHDLNYKIIFGEQLSCTTHHPI